MMKISAEILSQAILLQKCGIQVKVKGEWRYLYRAVDKQGQTIDFLLTEHRDTEAALRFLKKKAIRRNGLPKTITIDGSDANEAAIKKSATTRRAGGLRIPP